MSETFVQVDGRGLRVTSLEKVLYPATGFTKAHVLDYYTRIASALLPHLRDRPFTFKRHPEGVDGPHFFEKYCPSHRPSWVRTARVWSRSRGAWMDYCLIDDLATLVWAVNLDTLEMHPTLARSVNLERPDFVVFDLDPGPPAGLVECCRVALLVSELLEGFGLKCFAKTSGGKGIQIYLPLGKEAGYEETRTFARAVALHLEREHPGLVVSRQAKAERRGKVLIDWGQNDFHKTTVSVYSLRAGERPTVSFPAEWSDIRRTAKDGRVARLVVESDDALSRVERDGDRFAPVLSLRQALPAL